jgi:uncharacterized protein (DUF1499 family)
MAPRRWVRRGLAGLLAAVLLLAAGQLGLLQGRPPADLGVHQGRLKPPSVTPNSVSSQAHLYPGHPMQQAAMIEPLAVPGSAAEAIARVAQAVQTLPGAAIVTRRDDYLYVQFTTRWLKFVDDAEFWADGSGRVQVRSASRLGESDLGVNRARIEQVRSRLLGGPMPATGAASASR